MLLQGLVLVLQLLDLALEVVVAVVCQRRRRVGFVHARTYWASLGHSQS
jgi:hypothetical protein